MKRWLILILGFLVFSFAYGDEKTIVGFDCNSHDSYTIIYYVENLQGDIGPFTGTIVHQHISKKDACADGFDEIWVENFASSAAPSSINLLMDPSPKNVVNFAYDKLTDYATSILEGMATGVEATILELAGPASAIAGLIKGVWDAESAKNSDGSYDFFIINGTFKTPVGNVNAIVSGFISDEWWDSPILAEEEYFGTENVLADLQPPKYFYRSYVNKVRDPPSRIKTRLHGIDLYPMKIYFVKNGKELKDLTAGETVEVHGVYANSGCKPVEFAQMHAYFGGDTYIPGKKHSTGVEFIGGQNIFSPVPLMPMGIYDVILNREYTISGNGREKFCLKVDVDENAVEFNESNNLLCKEVIVNPPKNVDLLIKKNDVFISPRVFNYGDKIKVTYYVENVGDLESNWTVVKFVNGNYEHSYYLPPLAPGSFKKFIETFPVSAENSYIYIDTMHSNYESNEKNNIIEINTKPAPDFEILNLYPDSDPIVRNETTLIAEVKVGNEPPGPLYISFYDDDDIIGMTNISLIKKNGNFYPSNFPEDGKLYFNMSWRPSTAGIHKIKVVVDSPNLILETNEKNNELEKEIKVKPKQHGIKIVCSTLECETSAPISGKAHFSFLIENYGDEKEEIYINYRTYDNLTLLPSEVEIRPKKFVLPPKSFKKVELNLKIPEVKEGKYLFDVIAMTKAGNLTKNKTLLVNVYNNYKIEVLPICGKRICLTKNEIQNFKNREGNENMTFSFNITNEGEDVYLKADVLGLGNGKIFSKDSSGSCWGDRYCEFIYPSKSFSLKKGESKTFSVTIDASKFEAGNYNFTISFYYSNGILSEYPIEIKVKPKYDFDAYIISEKDINPYATWQPLYKIEVFNKGNAETKIVPEISYKNVNWTFYFNPIKILVEPISKGMFEIGVADFNKYPIKNEPLPAGNYQFEVLLKAGEFEKKMKFKPKVKAIHDISLSAISEKEIPRIKIPISFTLWNKGNIDEYVTVKAITNLSLDNYEKKVFVKAFSYNRKVPGIASGYFIIDGSKLVPGKEYPLKLRAEIENCNSKGCIDEKIIKIKSKPEFYLACEGKRACYHSIQPNGKTSFEIEIGNGLDHELKVKLDHTLCLNFTVNLNESEFSLQKNEIKKAKLEITAGNISTGECLVNVSTLVNNKTYDTIAVADLNYQNYTLYPGFNSIFAPSILCGNGVCDIGENSDNCCKDCGCPGKEVCANNKCVLPACFSNSECNDQNSCTIDVCLNPGTASASCSHSEITECKDNDGCCPAGCNALNDNDCEAKCGNNACEPGENKCTCPEDCGACAGSCKNEPCWEYECVNNECQCELKENCCGNYICEEGESFENCPDDCCQIDYPYPADANCDCPPGTQKIIIDENGSFVCY